jgi:NTE family protein
MCVYRLLSGSPAFFKIVLLFALLSLIFASPPAGADDTASGGQPDGGRRGGVVLVLSGGGTRGFAHVGVLKVLEREKIPIAGIVGTSMGSVVGGLYASGYSADDIQNIIEETDVMGLLADSGTRLRADSGNHRPAGEISSPIRFDLNKKMKKIGPLGLLSAVSLVNFLTKYTGHIATTDFNYLTIPFACVATDLATGEAVVLRNGNLASAIRASSSIPGILEPWPLDGRLLVDGGLVANLPVAIASEIFPGYPIVAVNLSNTTQPKTQESFVGLVDVMTQTIDIMTKENIKRNEDMADLVLYPDVGGFSMLDSGGYELIRARGQEAAEEHVERIIALSSGAPAVPSGRQTEHHGKVVRDIRVEGINMRVAKDIEKTYGYLSGRPYDADEINHAMERLAVRDDVATVDVEAFPVGSLDSDEVDIVFSIEKRPPFEIAVDGYITNLHNHRWLEIMMSARDLFSEGDSANISGRYGENEWGVNARYFTPYVEGRQWGFAYGSRKDGLEPEGMQKYSIERSFARALYYWENGNSRIGFGVAAEQTNAAGYDGLESGPYIYFNADTLDNLLMPSSGYSINSQIWWNTADIWVSRTNLTTYAPWKNGMHFVINLGLETGKKGHEAYRALLGDQEELFSLAHNPLAGDQAMWAHLGIGRSFMNSWWGSVRGELFTRYGMIMDDWSRKDDAWEVGGSLSIPGEFMNGKVLLIYDNHGEFTIGYTLGIPSWQNYQIP